MLINLYNVYPNPLLFFFRDEFNACIVVIVSRRLVAVLYLLLRQRILLTSFILNLAFGKRMRKIEFGSLASM